MIKFILGVLAAFGVLFLVGNPAGRTVAATLTAHFHKAATEAPTTALPKLEEEDSSAPPISGEMVPVVTKEATGAGVTPAVEAGADDTFAAVMDVYEKAEREQAGDNSTKN